MITVAPSALVRTLVRLDQADDVSQAQQVLSSLHDNGWCDANANKNIGKMHI